MSKVAPDQADGLRRMMARGSGNNVPCIVAVVGSGRAIGATSALMNLAAALVQQGQRVLLLDEQDGSNLNTPAAVWQVAAPGSWMDVASQRLSLDAAAGRAACGVQVLTAPRGATPPLELRTLYRQQVILIDATVDEGGCLSPLASQADHVVVVLQPQPASITAAYACIKRLHYAHALQQLRIMISGAVNEIEAQRVLGNLASTGSRYLALALEPAGAVVADPRVPHAQQLHLTVVEAFQTSPAALNFRRIAADLLQWPRQLPTHPRSGTRNGNSTLISRVNKEGKGHRNVYSAGENGQVRHADEIRTAGATPGLAVDRQTAGQRRAG